MEIWKNLDEYGEKYAISNFGKTIKFRREHEKQG